MSQITAIATPLRTVTTAGAPQGPTHCAALPLQRAKRLRILSKVLCGSVFFLLFMGANVTSHGAGLSVPDWPSSYGYNMFTFPVSFWVGGIFHEHVHRLVASGVGMITTLLVICTALWEPRRTVRRLTYLAFAAVVLQGTLGGLTVLHQLPTWISASHGVLGQTFFCITIAIAYLHSRELHEGGDPSAAPLQPLRYLAFMMVAVVFVQLAIGAVMRHSESGLAIPTLTSGWLPTISDLEIQSVNAVRQASHLAPISRPQVAIHVAHRIGGVIVALAILVGTSLLLSRSEAGRARRTVAALLLLTVLQFLLGVGVIYTARLPLPTSLHVVNGALVLGTAFFLTLRICLCRRG